MISAYLCGVGGMRNCLNSPWDWSWSNWCNFQRLRLNKYSHEIKKSSLWAENPLGPQGPPHWDFCKFPMARGSCYRVPQEELGITICMEEDRKGNATFSRVQPATNNSWRQLSFVKAMAISACGADLWGTLWNKKQYKKDDYWGLVGMV